MAFLLVVFFASLVFLAGCGGGGYPGASLTSVSASSLTLDAGQSVTVSASTSGNLPLSWTLSGTSCAGAACGTLSVTEGTSTTYTAPAGLSGALSVSLQAGISGTTASKTVQITVNPDAVISTPPPPGTQGVAYTTTFSVQGGTAPFRKSIVSGILPAGLTFNAATGSVSGTPTVNGTFNVVVQFVDTSDVPYTATATESFLINAPASSSGSGSGGSGSGGTGTGGTGTGGTGTGGTGTGAALAVADVALPPGTVGLNYSASLQATGGVAPYTWSVVAGALPTGLSLDTGTGIVSGMPVAAGNFPFTAQVKDAMGATANGVFSIEITAPATTAASLTLSSNSLPSGTVGTPYSATIGVGGGTAPYGCSITSGTLPAGLSLGASCAVSGVPLVSGTSTLTVAVTDAATPADSASGTVTLVINPAATLLLSSPPAATVGSPYTGTIGVTGGNAPYVCSVVGGSLPGGLTLGSGCVISGTPTGTGASNITVSASDSSNPANTTTGGITVTVNPAAPTLTLGGLASGTVGVSYSSTLGVGGGTAPYTCSISAGTLPAGLSLGSNCLVSGTPTVAGTSSISAAVTDSAGNSNTGQVNLTIAPAISLSLAAPTSAQVGTPYSGSIGVMGGTAPYTCTVVSGTLPAGLTLGSNCQVAGTPTTAGVTTVTVQATDAAGPAHTTTGQVSLTVAPAPLSVSAGTLPNGTVGVPYSSAIGITGGTAPYTCLLDSGGLPAGLTLSSSCEVTGTPAAAGTFMAGVQVTDSANPAKSTTGQVSLTITATPASLTLGTLPNGTVGLPYSSTLGVTGGNAPYTCTLNSGALPAGLTLGSNCQITGTPTAAGGTTLVVKTTDSSSPANSTTGQVSLTVTAASASLALGTLPNGTVGSPYSSTLGVTGGTAPYACSLSSGTLPAGLTLGSNCQVTGTPTAAGVSTAVVKATDSANPANSTTGQVSLTITAAPASLTLGTLSNGTVGSPYSGIVGVTGGTAPYTCMLSSGVLPAGLTLGSSCQVTGTPTAAGGTTLVVKATDSSSPANSATGQVSLTINPGVTLALTAPPSGSVGTAYNGSIGVAGGTAPYACTITAGTLPQGLGLGSQCAITGTPTTAGTANFTVQATDASNPANTGSATLSLAVNPAPATLTVGSPASATVSTPYTGSIPVTGGTAPYRCTLVSGTFPNGLSLGTDCSLTGTPTTQGATIVRVSATDSSQPALTTTGPVTITVNPLPPLSLTGSLPNAVLGSPYLQTIRASGGLGPYTYAVTAGNLPAGLSLSSTGVFSGTPTGPGVASFTVTATDSEGTPQTASLPLLLLVTYAPTAQDAELTGPYAFIFQGYDDAVAGVLAYRTASIGSFTADGAGGVSAGELDTNHQSSTAIGNTLSSHPFLGTYTLGTDGRGSLTLSTLTAAGTVYETHTYAVSFKSPVAPITVATEGSLIEYDSNQLAGTRGSGTLLAQTATAFASGLSGSFAFGMEGDTPCLVSCALNLNLFGPVAEVGQFTVSSGAVAGTADANIAATNYPSSALAGSVTAADSNGRLALSLTTANLPAGVSPSDYAVYLVDANEALVMSTDKHSAFLLLAGQVQRQTQTTFANASADGPYVGYENTATNPGLLGQTLQSVASLSTATLFQGTGNGAGSCTTDSVTQGGVTGLINELTGLGSVASTLQGVFGSYTRTGTSSCTVAANGREVLDYVAPVVNLPGLESTPAPRVVYLYGPNQGFFLETGYAGLGHLEQQTGAPFTVGTLDGTFVYGATPAGSVASTNTSGTFTANGQGTAQSTLDQNIGVGTVNVLQLGVAGSFTYSLTNGTFGTYLLGSTDVIYAIAPNRYVLLDTNATTTSPTVALIY